MFQKAHASFDIVDHEDKIAQVCGSRGSVQDAVPSTTHTRKLAVGSVVLGIGLCFSPPSTPTRPNRKTIEKRTPYTSSAYTSYLHSTSYSFPPTPSLVLTDQTIPPEEASPASTTTCAPTPARSHALRARGLS